MYMVLWLSHKECHWQGKLEIIYDCVDSSHWCDSQIANTKRQYHHLRYFHTHNSQFTWFRCLTWLFIADINNLVPAWEVATIGMMQITVDFLLRHFHQSVVLVNKCVSLIHSHEHGSYKSTTIFSVYTLLPYSSWVPY